LELFETKFGEAHLKGRRLRTSDGFNFDVALAASYTSKGIMRTVSVWEYPNGEKCVLANSNLQMQPSLRQNFLFLETPEGGYSAAESYSLENVGPVLSAELTKDEEAAYELIVNDFASFTQYSLYKLNRYMGVLRGDSTVV
jgi:hypothetical protein